MTAIGALVFCTDCGNLLDANTGKKAYIDCDVCGTSNKDTSSKVVVTHSKPSAFPSTLRTRLRSDVQEVSEAELSKEATIEQACEKCGHPEVRYYTQQLRSADEGSTVFFTCPNCGHKWNMNN
ncbi:Putative Zinc finger, TFIIS-type, DNA-directed RNA polymerase, M/15kDa subunit [Septoria linicola]|uniref:DNA-directed RNA polymerase subunit n=1 Tax=Septoria linicola TaxID=215465 RepID=A0A9Q9EMG5_9PEZI|nr:putative Zinc finger, TFIIS-type, DNA-directed RNA polymerase, M/15kDa subunit [Septoria linicola]USW56791.1 Putative Zinc finger, TFIIS-type, DNA-directed RNA polymerase, M/15kDa subunit [Septoria linicola]